MACQLLEAICFVCTVLLPEESILVFIFAISFCGSLPIDAYFLLIFCSLIYKESLALVIDPLWSYYLVLGGFSCAENHIKCLT